MSNIDPVWTKPMKITTRAMDPLGMSRVSGRITNELLTGITTMTSRARYYSFYIWNLFDVNKDSDIERTDQFTRAFYNRERVFMMACIAHQHSTDDVKLDHSSILGSIRGQRVWRESSNRIRMTFPFLANRLGGYGYYYRSSLANLGLTKYKNGRDTVTDLGKKVALSFEKSIEDLNYSRNINRNSITKKYLSRIGERSCLCLLPQKIRERILLQDIFFGLIKEAQNNYYAKKRKDTLSLILYCTQQGNKYGINIDDREFINYTYFQQMSNDKRCVHVDLPDPLINIKEHWRMFAVHDYFSYACESFLSGFLTMLDIHRRFDTSQLFEYVDNESASESVSSLLGVTIGQKSLEDILLLDAINLMISQLINNPNAILSPGTSKEYDDSCSLDSSLSELVLIDKIVDALDAEIFNICEVVLSASFLLLQLFVRNYHYWRNQNKYWKWLGSKTNHDLSPFRFVFELEQKLKDNSFSFLDFIKWIFNEYVMGQAQNVFIEKISRTGFSRPVSWFHIEGASFVKDRDYQPKYRSSRFDSCYTILKDLGLIEFDNNSALTKDGKDLLRKLGIEGK